jgi:hypothetical protein
MNHMNIKRQWHKSLLLFGALVIMSLALFGSASAQTTTSEPTTESSAESAGGGVETLPTPTAPVPTAPEPIATEPTVTEPVTNEPVTATAPVVASEPFATKPAATEPTAATSTEPVSGETTTPEPVQTTSSAACERTIKADVVAFDQVITYNRLGAVNPAGMMYALRRDVASIDTTQGLVAGNVKLKIYKRPRPLALRMNEGDCLQISFQNLLEPYRANDNQPATRTASAHVVGLQLVGGIASDGSNVGKNASSLVAPGGSAIYTYYAQREGNHLLYSTAATTGGEGNGGSLAMGLFGAVNVEKRGAQWFRSQVTAKEIALATKKDAAGVALTTGGGHPVMDYDAVYPTGYNRAAGSPILRMLDANNNIVHSDLNAIITGSNPSDATLKGHFPAGTYRANLTEPNRDQPFREFTVVYHDEIKAVQAFDEFDEEKNPISRTRCTACAMPSPSTTARAASARRFSPTASASARWRSATIALRRVLPFLMGHRRPGATRGRSGQCQRLHGQTAPRSQSDQSAVPRRPSNVHHSYMNDHVKMRVVHAGPSEHHIHHLHAHQWLHTPDSDNSSYLDSQALGPGYSFTTEIAHGGSGNRNKTAGDSIFHCHFYPHFAQGMWELWRVHDAFEAGTALSSTGIPLSTSRKLPDGEIAAGTPIPALIPLPGIALPLMPNATFQGYPFYIPGVAGTPPAAPAARYGGRRRTAPPRHRRRSGRAPRSQAPRVRPESGAARLRQDAHHRAGQRRARSRERPPSRRDGLPRRA